MSSSSDRCHALGQAPSGSNESKTHLRFLDFPAEIRIRIYEYLLLAKYVTERKENPEFFEHQPYRHYYNGREREKLDVCQNVWIERSSYSLNILRVNRQLYLESSKIFSENSWIFIRVNRDFFAQTLKTRGFSVLRVNSAQGVKISILTLSIEYRPDDDRPVSDNFLMSPDDAGKLRRALSTSSESEYAKLTFIAGRDFPKEDNPITEAFRGLWSVGSASVCGPGDGQSLGTMTHEISDKSLPPWSSLKLVTGTMLVELQNSLLQVQALHARNSWREIASECEASILYVIDCHSIYRCLYPNSREMYPDPQTAEQRDILEIYTKLLLLLIETLFSMKDYEAVLVFSRHAMNSYGPLDSAISQSFFRRAGAELDRRHGISEALLDDSPNLQTQHAESFALFEAQTAELNTEDPAVAAPGPALRVDDYTSTPIGSQEDPVSVQDDPSSPSPDSFNWADLNPRKPLLCIGQLNDGPLVGSFGGDECVMQLDFGGRHRETPCINIKTFLHGMLYGRLYGWENWDVSDRLRSSWRVNDFKFYRVADCLGDEDIAHPYVLAECETEEEKSLLLCLTFNALRSDARVLDPKFDDKNAKLEIESDRDYDDNEGKSNPGPNDDKVEGDDDDDDNGDEGYPCLDENFFSAKPKKKELRDYLYHERIWFIAPYNLERFEQRILARLAWGFKSRGSPLSNFDDDRGLYWEDFIRAPEE